MLFFVLFVCFFACFCQCERRSGPSRPGLGLCVTNGDSLQSCWSDDEHSREVAIAIQGAVILSSFLLSLCREATGGTRLVSLRLCHARRQGSVSPQALAPSLFLCSRCCCQQLVLTMTTHQPEAVLLPKAKAYCCLMPQPPERDCVHQVSLS